MKKLLVLLLVAVICIVLSRRASTGSPQHQRGTPDHWPPVVRKPDAADAPAA